MRGLVHIYGYDKLRFVFVPLVFPYGWGDAKLLR